MLLFTYRFRPDVEKHGLASIEGAPAHLSWEILTLPSLLRGHKTYRRSRVPPELAVPDERCSIMGRFHR